MPSELREIIKNIPCVIKEYPSGKIPEEAVNKAISNLKALLKRELGGKKEHREWCRSFKGKNFQCNCMHPDYNQKAQENLDKIDRL